MKQNHLLLIIGLLVLVVIGIVAYQNNKVSPPQITAPKTPSNTPTTPVEETIEPTQLAGADPRNATYIIEEQEVKLTGGKAEVEVAPGSASKMVVTVFDDSANGDLNGDDYLDNAVTLNVTTGGSGSFFYIAAALQNSDRMYEGTNAVLLGDRIAPQNNQIVDQEIIANYTERAEGESFDVQPSVAVSKHYVYQNETLSEKTTQ